MELLDFLISGRKLSIFKDGGVFREIALRYSDFDGANGGTWKKYISIPIIEIPHEDASYIVVIDGSNVYVYSADGVLKTQGVIPGFWENVRSDGLDIRVFDHNFRQLRFLIVEFDYNSQKAIIAVRLESESEELYVAFGNPFAIKSSYENLVGKSIGNAFASEDDVIFFDDFDGDDVDVSEWDIIAGSLGNGNYAVSDSVLLIHHSPFQIEHKFDPMNRCIVEFRYLYSGITYFGNLQEVSGVYFGNYIQGYNQMLLYDTDSGEEYDVGNHYNNIWATLDIVKRSNEVCLYRDGTLIACKPNTNYVEYIRFGSGANRDCTDMCIDYVKVYKLNDPARFGTPYIGIF